MDRESSRPGNPAGSQRNAGQMAALNLALTRLDQAIEELSGRNGAEVTAKQQLPPAPAPPATATPGPLPAPEMPFPAGASSTASNAASQTPIVPGAADNTTAAAGNAADSLLVLPSQGSHWSRQEDIDSESLRLLTRFLSGATLWGADQLLERLHFRQAEFDAGSIELPPAQSLAEADPGDLARYFVLGSLAWGRRKMLRLANDAFHTSADVTASLAHTADRLTDNWLLRPLRDPVDAALAQLVHGVRLRIQEGWQEEQISRWLATQTIPDITHDSTDYIIDYISENPQLAALVREQVNQTTLGLGDTVMDNSRALSGSADNLVEGIVRKLLRLTPRSKLLPSPLAGRPQDMYAHPPSLTKGESHDDR
jgi:hypothetical protein